VSGNGSKNPNNQPTNNGEQEEKVEIKIGPIAIKGRIGIVGVFLVGLLGGLFLGLFSVTKSPELRLLLGIDKPAVVEPTKIEIEVWEVTSDGRIELNPSLGGAFEVNNRQNNVEIYIVNPSEGAEYRWDQQTEGKGDIDIYNNGKFMTISGMAESEGEIILQVCEKNSESYCKESSLKNIRIVEKKEEE
jgi:hypothetical protein